MKKGILFLALMATVSFLFAADPVSPTTVAAVKTGDDVAITITWKPAETYVSVFLRGNYDGDQWAAGKEMTKGADGSWSIVVTKKMGDTFEYKYMADGEWQDGEENYPATVGNPFGGVNGFVKVDDGILSGKLTKAFAPKFNINLNMPISIKYTDQAGGEAKASENFAGYFKIGGEFMPNLTTWMEINLHGLGTSKDLWKENNTEAQNLTLAGNAAEILFRGISVINNQYTELQKFLVEYTTPYADIAYSDGYYKPVPESYGSPFYFQVYGVDGAKAENVLMGNFRVKKAGLNITPDISLDYLASWGAGARKTYNKAIWDGGVTTGSGSWDDNKFGLYGVRSLVMVKTPVATFGLNVNQVSEAVSGPDGNLDDYFAVLNNEVILGAKGTSGIATWVGQFGFHNYGQLKENNKFGRQMALGAKVNLALAPLDLGFDLRLVGADYKTIRFYSDSDELKGGIYPDSNINNLYVQLKPKYSANGITAGLDAGLKVWNPLGEETDKYKDMETDYKLYGGYAAGALTLDAYAKLGFKIYDVSTGKESFGFNGLGLQATYKDTVPGLLNSTKLMYSAVNNGAYTTVTTDNNLSHTLLLEAVWATETKTFIGASFVGGDSVTGTTDDQATYGLNLGIAQGFVFNEVKNFDKFQIFAQVRTNGFNSFDSGDQYK